MLRSPKDRPEARPRLSARFSREDAMQPGRAQLPARCWSLADGLQRSCAQGQRAFSLAAVTRGGAVDSKLGSPLRLAGGSMAHANWALFGVRGFRHDNPP
jgi:hypothetical protein